MQSNRKLKEIVFPLNCHAVENCVYSYGELFFYFPSIAVRSAPKSQGKNIGTNYTTSFITEEHPVRNTEGAITRTEEEDKENYKLPVCVCVCSWLRMKVYRVVNQERKRVNCVKLR